MVAVELRFDPKSSEQLLALWAALQQIYGSPKLTELGEEPHISLALFPNEEPGFLRDALRALSQDSQPFELSWDSVATFATSEGVVYLSPKPSDELLALHSALHQRLQNERVEGNPYYTPESWVPHCTVATDVPPEQIPLVVRQAREAIPGSVRVESVAVVAYRPARELCRFEFQATREDSSR